MATLQIVNNSHEQLMYHTEDKIVHHHFEQTLDTEPLKVILDGGVALLKQYGAQKWLSNNCDLEDGEWVNTVLPNIITAGWKYWTLIVPEQTRGRMSMVEFVNSFYKRGVRIMVFVNYESAWNWLKTIDQIPNVTKASV